MAFSHPRLQLRIVHGPQEVIIRYRPLLKLRYQTYRPEKYRETFRQRLFHKLSTRHHYAASGCRCNTDLLSFQGIHTAAARRRLRIQPTADE